MASRTNNYWPPCTYCGHKWPRQMQFASVVMLPEAALETTISCPCRKTAIVMRLAVKSVKLIDVEAYKHWPLPETAETPLKYGTKSLQHSPKIAPTLPARQDSHENP